MTSNNPHRVVAPLFALLLFTFAICTTGCAPQENPFIVAARTGMTPELERAAAGGADINGRSQSFKTPGQTPLMAAVQENHPQAAEWLIAHGANPNLTDDDHDTAFHVAARFGSTAAAEVLIHHHVDIEARNERGATPLLIAASGWRAMVELLLQYKANPDAIDEDGLTPLIYAARGGFSQIVRILVEHGANLNTRGPRGQTAWSQAMEQKHMEVAKYLASHGATTQPATKEVKNEK